MNLVLNNCFYNDYVEVHWNLENTPGSFKMLSNYEFVEVRIRAEVVFSPERGIRR